MQRNQKEGMANGEIEEESAEEQSDEKEESINHEHCIIFSFFSFENNILVKFNLLFINFFSLF